VTHDRYLVDRLATQLWIIDPKKRVLEAFPGTWAEYEEASRREEAEPEARPTGTDDIRRGKWSEEQRQARRDGQRARREREAREQRAVELEGEIHHLEQQLKTLEEEISSASEAQEARRIHELGTLYGELESQLKEHLDLWAELAG